MAMEISKSFVVKASAEAAWNFLTDPARVARCLPGAAITSQVDERTHAGTITVKVGPVAATYKGTMRFERLDAATRTAEIVAAGQDVRGKGGADMRMTSRLVERAPGETEVLITSQVNVMGILAQFGRGMIQDVSDQMFGTFVSAMRAELEKPDNPGQADLEVGRPREGRVRIAWRPQPTPDAMASPVVLHRSRCCRLDRRWWVAPTARAARKPALWIGRRSFSSSSIGCGWVDGEKRAAWQRAGGPRCRLPAAGCAGASYEKGVVSMIPASFDYHAPASLSEAIALLQRHGDQAKVLSGGQSLLPLLKLRVGAAGHLVDIGRIPGLEYIKEEDGFLKIGGRTRESALERSDVIKAKYPILHDTALVIADPLVRNRATVGGNLAHADPANDHPATMLALGAEVTATGAKASGRFRSISSSPASSARRWRRTKS